jgi:LDH2 family malate/lactate/ureidoglycolate dehydrogenase
MEELRVTAKQLKKLSYELLKALGLSEEDAMYGAETLNAADLRGVDTHGVGRIRAYANMIAHDKINLHAKLTPIVEKDSLLYLDAQNGLGVVMAARAMEWSIEKAKKSGVCVTSIRNSGHWGISGYYALKAAQAGCMCISVSNSGPAMVPFNGSERILGNSPFSFSFPAGKKYDYPIMFDIACSTVAAGKLEMALRSGREIPSGWLVDEKGNDTNDPKKFFMEGCGLTSFGGHKGYVLAVLLEIMASVLSGAAYGDEIGTRVSRIFPTDPPGMKENVGHLFIVVDIGQIRPIDEIQDYLDAYLDRIKNSRAGEGREILIPGELEARISKERAEKEYSIHYKIGKELLDVAIGCGYMPEGSTVEALFEKCK